MIRTRFAPSPTGDLHVGGAWAALASFALGGARAERLLRIEDIDTPRVVAGAAARIMDDLRWLGLCWQEPVLWQSQRGHHYEQAMAELGARGLLYPCDCSRSDLRQIASAPHAGEELRYPGLCRDKDPQRSMRRPPAWRAKIPPGTRVDFVDALTGAPVSSCLDADVGDFVLRRGDGVFAYQLVAAVDDGLTGVTHVVRGRDLLASTARQLWLLQELDLPAPCMYLHLPLVVMPSGERLAKRLRSLTVASLREHGFGAEAVLGELAHGLGLRDTSAPVSADALAFEPERARALRHGPSWVPPVHWLALLDEAT